MGRRSAILRLVRQKPEACELKSVKMKKTARMAAILHL